MYSSTIFFLKHFKLWNLLPIPLVMNGLKAIELCGGEEIWGGGRKARGMKDGERGRVREGEGGVEESEGGEGGRKRDKICKNANNQRGGPKEKLATEHKRYSIAYLLIIIILYFSQQQIKRSETVLPSSTIRRNHFRRLSGSNHPH